MLLLVAGGVASGKTAYAAQLAVSLGREAILISCPPFPDIEPVKWSMPQQDETRRIFSWMELAADANLASTVQLINRQSNIFRADRRVLVLDSLSGWLRAWAQRAKTAGWEPGKELPDPSDNLREVVGAFLSFEGKRIIVTEEAAVGMAPDPWERWYAEELAAAVRRLAEQSHSLYRMTAGLAVELRGQRVKRGKRANEHIHTDRG